MLNALFIYLIVIHHFVPEILITVCVFGMRERFSCDESSCLMQSCLFCECNIFVRFFDGVDADAVGLFHFMFHKMKVVATACYMYNIKFSLLLND